MVAKYAVFSYAVGAQGEKSVPVGVAIWSATTKTHAVRVIDTDEKIIDFDSKMHLRFVRHASAQIERWAATNSIPYPSERTGQPWSDEWWLHVRDLFVHELRLSEPVAIDDVSPAKAVSRVYDEIIDPHRCLRKVGQEIGAFPVELTFSHVVESKDSVDRVVEHRSPAKDPYFSIWSKSSADITRWIVFRLTNNDVARFLHADISVRGLILGARDGHVYIVDTQGEFQNMRRVAFLRVASIPKDMLPQQDSYHQRELEPRIANNVVNTKAPKEQMILLDGPWNAGSLSKLERRFTQGYAFNALFARGAERDISWIDNKLVNLVFAGAGGSHVQALDRLVEYVPKEDKPAFESIQLSSPGVVSYAVDVGPATRLRVAIELIRKSGEELRKKYDVLHGILNNINREVNAYEEEDRQEGGDLKKLEVLNRPNDDLRHSAVALAETFGLDYRRIRSVAGSDVNAAELVGNYYRRIRDLYEYEYKFATRAMIV